MSVEIVPYEEERIPEVRAFNRRLRDAGVTYQFPESHIPSWLPPSGSTSLYQESFLAVDGEVVRGAYILKHQDFLVGDTVRSIGTFQLPLSEGTFDRASAGVGVQLLRHALRRQPLLYTLGIGGQEEAAARLLLAARFELVEVPFLFKVLHARRFLREIRPLRRTRARRLAMDAAAFSGAGVVGIRAMQRLGARASTPGADVMREGQVFDERCDDLWAAASANLTWAAVRDRAVLSRLYDTPGNRFVRVEVTDGDELAGWAVLLATDWTAHKYFGAMRTGSIVDLLVRPGHERALIDAAVDRLHAEGVDIIVTNQSLAPVRDALRGAGFLTGPSNFLLAAGPALRKLLPPLASGLGQMHFNRGDGDGPINL